MPSAVQRGSVPLRHSHLSGRNSQRPKTFDQGSRVPDPWRGMADSGVRHGWPSTTGIACRMAVTPGGRRTSQLRDTQRAFGGNTQPHRHRDSSKGGSRALDSQSPRSAFSGSGLPYPLGQVPSDRQREGFPGSGLSRSVPARLTCRALFEPWATARASALVTCPVTKGPLPTGKGPLTCGN